MNFIENLLGFVTDKSKRLSTRAVIIILSFLAIIAVDNILGFSHYYNNQRKLNQLQNISVLLKDTALNPDVKSELLKLQEETIERKNIIDRTQIFFESIPWSNSKNPKEEPSEKPSKENSEEKSNFWLFVSASGLYILAFVLTLLALFISDKKTPFLNQIVIIVFILILFGVLSCFNYWLFNLILPEKLFGSWNWNYVFNFLLQIGLSGLVLLISKLYNRTKKNTTS